jgi:hypothetical protein
VRGNPLRYVGPFGLQDQEPSPKSHQNASPNTGVHDDEVNGAGKDGQDACDVEDIRQQAEQRAADALARGDYLEYESQRRRARDNIRRYDEALQRMFNPRKTPEAPAPVDAPTTPSAPTPTPVDPPETPSPAPNEQ